MTQIAEQVGIHKSTAHRLLATLERKRFVHRDPESGIYRIGIRLLQMAYLTLEHNDLRSIATPYLIRLRDQCLETIHLAVLDDTDVVFVNIVESPARVKLAASLGQRLPAFATASGKAMFAFMNREKVQKILDRGMPRYTGNTPQSAEAIFSDLETIRKHGFAISDQEYEEEINAVAAPIFDFDMQPAASVAVAGPAYRLTRERMLEIGPVVVAAANEISSEFKLMALPQ
jgi:IclR family acetate operon transcriptional repressor